jgi:hypothetical protein
MAEPIRRKDDGGPGRDVDAAPSLDRAGGISRDELNPDRSGNPSRRAERPHARPPAGRAVAALSGGDDSN